MLTIMGLNKKASIFLCQLCDFKCSYKSNLAAHLLTRKHLVNEHGKDVNTKNGTANFVCVKCEKKYTSRVGLWKHDKNCTLLKESSPSSLVVPNNMTDSCNNTAEFKTILIEVLKSNNALHQQNKELQQQILTSLRNPINITTNNSNNKTFNLNFFLNEECKDAMNIMEFVDSFTLQLSDLESVGKLGYVEGISKIIINKLSALDIHKRPIHCSDAKREILHIKDNDKWEKESADNARLKKAIKYISKKNSNLLVEWSDAHPGSKHISHNANDTYMNLIVQAMGGTGELSGNENKIIKNIAKEVLILK
jgi:hypothetical protein